MITRRTLLAQAATGCVASSKSTGSKADAKLKFFRPCIDGRWHAWHLINEDSAGTLGFYQQYEYPLQFAEIAGKLPD